MPSYMFMRFRCPLLGGGQDLTVHDLSSKIIAFRTRHTLICMLLGHVAVIEGDSYNRSWIRNLNMECSHLRWCVIVQCMKASMEVGSSLSFSPPISLSVCSGLSSPQRLGRETIIYESI